MRSWTLFFFEKPCSFKFEWTASETQNNSTRLSRSFIAKKVRTNRVQRHDQFSKIKNAKKFKNSPINFVIWQEIYWGLQRISRHKKYQKCMLTFIFCWINMCPTLMNSNENVIFHVLFVIMSLTFWSRYIEDAFICIIILIA